VSGVVQCLAEVAAGQYLVNAPGTAASSKFTLP
jgi:hypothetical protein